MNSCRILAVNRSQRMHRRSSVREKNTETWEDTGVRDVLTRASFHLSSFPSLAAEQKQAALHTTQRSGHSWRPIKSTFPRAWFIFCPNLRRPGKSLFPESGWLFDLTQSSAQLGGGGGGFCRSNSKCWQCLHRLRLFFPWRQTRAWPGIQKEIWED